MKRIKRAIRNCPDHAGAGFCRCNEPEEDQKAPSSFGNYPSRSFGWPEDEKEPVVERRVPFGRKVATALRGIANYLEDRP